MRDRSDRIPVGCLIKLIRLGVAIAALGGGYHLYQSADTDRCAGPLAEQWFEAVDRRLTEADTAMDAFIEASTRAERTAVANGAQARYLSQSAEEPPACLTGLQNKVCAEFYYEWKLYQALAADHHDEAETYRAQLLRAREAALQEFERLAVQYDWNVSQDSVHATVTIMPAPSPYALSPSHTPRSLPSSFSSMMTAVASACVSWKQALRYEGRRICMCGTVHHIQNTDTASFIHFSSGDQAFYAYSYKWFWYETLAGNQVRICGVVETNYGRPRMEIDDPNQVSVLP